MFFAQAKDRMQCHLNKSRNLHVDYQKRVKTCLNKNYMQLGWNLNIGEKTPRMKLHRNFVVGIK